MQMHSFGFIEIDIGEIVYFMFISWRENKQINENQQQIHFDSQLK